MIVAGSGPKVLTAISGKIIAKQDLSDVTGGINEIELNHFMERFHMVGFSGLKTLAP